jgi:hypothetical protein
MHLKDKDVNLKQLEEELRTAGFEVRGLGMDGDFLHTYNETGEKLLLPSSAESVIEAHVPEPLLPIESLEEKTHARLTTATTIAQLKAVMLDYFAEKAPKKRGP